LVPFHGTQSLILSGINTSNSWRKTGSRPAFIFGDNYFKPACSRSNAEGSRVSAPAPRTTWQDVEVAGSLLVISATAHALEKYKLRSLTVGPPQLLKDMEFCRCLFPGRLPSCSRWAWWAAFSRRSKHLLSRAPITITCRVRTVLSMCRYCVMGGVCLVELSIPGVVRVTPFI